MVKALVIVESPAKVKTINKILGKDYKVLSSMGHLVDLPASSFGVDVEHDFKPKMVIVRKKQKILTQLKKEAKTKKIIYIATDPDREGEAIGWNIVNQIPGEKKIFRVTFHEITKEAVQKAFDRPREFNKEKIQAQMARRILDRIVGYELSPLLWKKVGSRLSAGRVQSVALRMIVERDRAIARFVPQEYWQITAELQKDAVAVVLSALLDKIDDKKCELFSEASAQKVMVDLKDKEFVVSEIIVRETKRQAPPPYITSTLQQDAFNKLGFNTSKTMMIAQQLYEGVDLEEGAVGLITYMRTDSVSISQEAVTRVREVIAGDFGPNYVPEKPNVYKSKKSAQEAHEAIRPSDVSRSPQAIAKYLDADQLKLYELIWKRFLACQMCPAVFLNTRMEIRSGPYLFVLSGSTLKFDGYLGVIRDDEEAAAAAVDFSAYQKGDVLKLLALKPSQHFTKPPGRYSEATLVRALEEAGIGRPSTYAPIINTLVFRNYVYREKGYLQSTELGAKICDLLVEYFPKVMDIGFTAGMEESLDKVEEGTLDQVQLLGEFYQPFKQELDYATANITKTTAVSDRLCPECQRPMVIKWGRNGKFLSCSGFPECKVAQPFFTGVKCPETDCAGELVERRSKRGSLFFGCSRFPDCRHISRKLPESQPE